MTYYTSVQTTAASVVWPTYVHFDHKPATAAEL